MRAALATSRLLGLGSGDAILLSILLADFFGALAGSMIHLTMVWWVLQQGVSGPVVSMLILCIFLPLNIGVLLTGVAVARFGSRRLLIASKLLASGGAFACFLLLATEALTVPVLGIIAILTYGAMAPSVAADISRAPAIAKLAKRRLETFHAGNGVVMVAGQVLGLFSAAWLWEARGPAPAVAIGIAFVLVSTALTWLGFPRDRMAATSAVRSSLAGAWALSKSVLDKLDGSRIDRRLVLVTAGIIAISEGCIEVAFPMAVAAAGLPASALSQALFLALATGITAMLFAERTYRRIALSTALLTIAGLLFAALGLAAFLPEMTGFLVAVGATSAAASASGTYTITALQEHMPVSLQAQSIGLWQCLVLSVGSVAILVTGVLSDWSLPLLTGFAALCLFATLWRRLGTARRPAEGRS